MSSPKKRFLILERLTWNKGQKLIVVWAIGNKVLGHTFILRIFTALQLKTTVNSTTFANDSIS
jgi:hypothetical protein